MPSNMTVIVVWQMNADIDIECINKKINKHFAEECISKITISNENETIITKTTDSFVKCHHF